MSARQRMTMRCTTQRNAETDTDGYGLPATPDDDDYLTDLACFVWYTKGGSRRTKVEDKTTLTLDTAHMICPSGTDVLKSDRIGEVRDRLGAQLFGAFTIDSIHRRSDHFELLLAEVS